MRGDDTAHGGMYTVMGVYHTINHNKTIDPKYNKYDFFHDSPPRTALIVQIRLSRRWRDTVSLAIFWG